MSLAEFASDETLFNNQAGILCGSGLVANFHDLCWSAVPIFAFDWRQQETVTVGWNRKQPVTVPYICYSGQWSTAFTNNTLPQAPTCGMNEAHTYTHLTSIISKSNHKPTTHTATNTVVTREEQVLTAVLSRIPFFY